MSRCADPTCWVQPHDTTDHLDPERAARLSEPKVDARLVGLGRTKDRPLEWVGEVEVTPREQMVLEL